MKKKTATITAAASPTECKGTNFDYKNKILSVLRNEKSTAIQLNRRTGTNDVRKYISLLRKSGHPIRDYCLERGRKVYFMEKDNQLEINFDGKEVRNG